MRIVVDVKNLQDEIISSLEDYEKEYEKLLKLYYEKLQKYVDYVRNQINLGSRTKQLKSAPYPPSWLRDNFVDVVQALKVHNSDKVEMTDQEYTQMKKGIERLRDDIRTTTASLNSINY